MNVLTCCVRKKFVRNTPEELVRQSLLGHLLGEFGCSSSLTSVEISLSVIAPLVPKPLKNRRVDIVCFAKNQNGVEPLLLIECKRKQPSIGTISQICGYNLYVRCPIFAIAWPGMIAIYNQGVVFYMGEQALMPTYVALQNLAALKNK